MLRFKRALVLMLTICMFTSSSGGAFPALAEEIASIDPLENEITGYDSSSVTDVTDVQNSGNKNVQPPIGDSEADTAPAPENTFVDTSNHQQVVDVSAIEYIYIDRQIAMIGEEQNVVVGFKDSIDAATSMTLELTGEDGSTFTLPAVSMDSRAALFKKQLDDNEIVQSYQLTALTYIDVSGVDVKIDIASSAKESGDYRFDIVSKSTFQAFNDSPSEDGIQAMTLSEDGIIEASDSVGEAIETADAEGVEESQQNATAPRTASRKARSAVSATRENYLIVAIDAGHGGYDGGASGYGVSEKDVNLSIAQHFANELSTYTGVTPYLTRSNDTYVGLEERVNTAAEVGADVFISVHVNSGAATATGAEVWVPNNSSYNNSVHLEGQVLGTKIEDQLVKLGLNRRGVLTRNYPQNGDAASKYADGSVADYYSVIRNARKKGIPGIIVEHAFVSNPSDASKLANNEFRKKLGIADATGVAQQYNLGRDAVAASQSSVAIKAHVTNLGWESTVYDNKVAGTTGKSFNLEAFQVSLKNSAASVGGVQYRATADGSWTDRGGWQADGVTAGITGQSKDMQAIQMQLTGNAANKYDIYYRVHAANVGWLGWAKNGATAGSKGYGYNIQAIEVTVVSKGAAAPGSAANAYMEKVEVPVVKTFDVTYSAHVRNIGWQSAMKNGGLAGTTGKSLPVEALKVSLANKPADGSIEVKAHVANIGWQDWVKEGSTAGTTGKNYAIEALALRLTGELADQYDIWYQVHSADFGWLGWAKNGDRAGSAGYGKSVEAVRIKLVKKNGAAPGSTASPYRQQILSGSAQVADYGWLVKQYVENVGTTITLGTTGKSKQLETLRLNVSDAPATGSIEYSAHVANIGWQGWVKDNAQAGTVGRSLAIEAVKIKLTDDLANKYDVYYRVHSADFGWLGWAKNGDEAGTQGYSKHAEAVQVQLVKKGAAAPGSTSGSFVYPTVGYTAHVANIGWQTRQFDGATAGTTGRGLAIEAITLALGPQVVSGSVQINAHVRNIGWQGYTFGTAGTMGRGLSIEAVRIKLTGDADKKYDVYYRVHSANMGWLGWTKNGASAGTEGYGYAAEAIQIKLVNKGDSSISTSGTAFRSTTSYSIMGKTTISAGKMAEGFKKKGITYPSNVYKSRGASSIEEFCNTVVRAASDEGVRGEVLFAQAMKETGWLIFDGQVKAEQCNFAGIGAINGGASGASFDNVYTGLLAQAQHLKAYASTAKLNKECVDPRFNLVSRGVAPTLDLLDGRWAVPGIGYGDSIMSIIKSL